MPAYLMDVDFEEFTRLFRDVEFHLPLPSKWLSLMVMNLERPPTFANLISGPDTKVRYQTGAMAA